jgi:DNA modification methylase
MSMSVPSMPSTRQNLVCGDSRRLDSVPAESVDLIVTSPPYPMIEMWDEAFAALSPEVRPCLDRGDGEAAFRLMHVELDRTWDEVSRVLRPGGVACVNIGDATRTIAGVFRLYTNHARILGALEHRGLQSLPAILWRKQTNAPNKFMGSGMLPPGAYVTLEHEYILVLRKGPPRRFELPAEKLRRRRSAFFWEERNIWFSDVWDLKGARQDIEGALSRERSGAFPLELAYRLVAMFSVQGDAVLDPFAGTGTTLMACAALGRNGIGVEIDGEIADRARAALATSAERLNAWTRKRLERHCGFVRDRTASHGILKHVNAPHGFAVVTLQETELELDLIGGIVPDGPHAFEVGYAATGPGQLSLALGQGDSPA